MECRGMRRFLVCAVINLAIAAIPPWNLSSYPALFIGSLFLGMYLGTRGAVE